LWRRSVQKVKYTRLDATTHGVALKVQTKVNSIFLEIILTISRIVEQFFTTKAS